MNYDMSSTTSNSGAYSHRNSLAGGKYDPVLASFSPVGSGSKLKEEVSVGQLSQPRLTTPTQSGSTRSSLSTNNTLSFTKLEDDLRASEVVNGSTQRDHQTSYYSHQYTPDVVGDKEGHPSSRDFKRLSISGRLAATSSKIIGDDPVTPPAYKTPTSRGRVGLAGMDEKVSDRFSLGGSHLENHAGGFSVKKSFSASVAENVTLPKMESMLDRKDLSVTSSIDHTSSRSVLKKEGGNGLVVDGLPEMLKNHIESTMAGYMQEIRNDIQNLHVDLIKQSIAQQSMMKQIMGMLPDAVKKLADDNRQLREENERLRSKQLY